MCEMNDKIKLCWKWIRTAWKSLISLVIPSYYEKFRFHSVNIRFIFFAVCQCQCTITISLCRKVDDVQNSPTRKPIKPAHAIFGSHVMITCEHYHSTTSVANFSIQILSRLSSNQFYTLFDSLRSEIFIATRLPLPIHITPCDRNSLIPQR